MSVEPTTFADVTEGVYCTPVLMSQEEAQGAVILLIVTTSVPFSGAAGARGKSSNGHSGRGIHWTDEPSGAEKTTAHETEKTSPVGHEYTNEGCTLPYKPEPATAIMRGDAVKTRNRNKLKIVQNDVLDAIVVQTHSHVHVYG